MSSVRTFIALELAPAARESIAQLIAALRGGGADVKWVDEANLHLTLKFLGDVPEERLSEIGDAVSAAVEAVAPFELRCAGLGAFPNVRRPSTLWLGASEGAEAAALVQKAVNRATKQLGYPSENRKFHPHVTIGRLRRGGRIGQLAPLLEAHEAFDAGVSRIEEAVVFSSELTREGPIYRAVRRAPLGAKNSEQSE